MGFKGIHIPSGCTVLVGDSVSSLVDVGVLPEGSATELGISYDAVQVKGSKNEDVMRYFKNLKAEAKFAIYEIILDNIARFAKGLMNVTSVAGAPVSGKEQRIPSSWESMRVYSLSGQNANGSAPVVTGTADPNKVLVEGDDFHLIKMSTGEYGIALVSGGPAGLVESDEVVLSLDYTPTAHKRAVMGAASVQVQTQVVRFLKEQGGKKFQITLFSAVNTAGLTFSFPASSADNPTSMDITMSGGLDSSRAVGEQLIEIIDEIGLTV